MRIASRVRPECRAASITAPFGGALSGSSASAAWSVATGSLGGIGGFTAANSADALSWTWSGDPVTSWKVKWGTASGTYTQNYTVSDPNARAVMFNAFLTVSGDYYIAVFAVDAGGEGDHTDEVAVSYTA
jgi:hypothetical protein